VYSGRCEVLKQFKAAPYKVSQFELWGNGHTFMTDPSRQGWRRMMVGNVVLVFNDRYNVCASMRRIGEVWDVALYWGTKDDILPYLKGGPQFHRDGSTISPRYVEVDDYPGFGLTVLEHLMEEAKILAECEQDEFSEE
jgi:hypothetical protein